MKKFICDYCEREIPRPWMKIRVRDRLSDIRLHYCQKCAMFFLEVFQEMEERKEEENED